MERDEFKRRLDELGNIISDGFSYFAVWRGLNIGDADTVSALNAYRGFFVPIKNGLLWMSIMQFAKVFDKNPRTVSLPNLLEVARAERATLLPHITDKDIDNINQALQENTNALEGIKRLRDQRIAHHDAIPDSEKALLYGEMNKLTEAVIVMYNTISQGHNRSTTSLDLLTRTAELHTNQVVELILREQQNRIKARDEALRNLTDTEPK